MSAQKLVNNVVVTDLAPGASVVLPHGIKRVLNFLPTTPNIAIPNECSAIAVTAVDDDNITFENKGLNVESATFYVALVHSIQGDGVTNLWNGEVSFNKASLSTCFIFRPGDPLGNHDNVYVDFPAVAEAMAQVEGCKRLNFDPTYGPLEISTPGVYDMTGVTWGSDPVIGDVTVVVQDLFTIKIKDGVEFTGLRLFNGFNGPSSRIENQGTSGVSPISDFVDFAITAFGIGGGGTVQLQSAAGADPLIKVGTPLLTVVFFDCDNFSGFGQQQAVADAPALEVTAGAISGNFAYIVFGKGNGQLSENAISGTGTCDLLIGNSPLSGQPFGATWGRYSAKQLVAATLATVVGSMRLSGQKTVVDTDTLDYNFIHLLAGTGAEALNLPLSQTRPGEWIVVKNTGAGGLDVDPDAAETINGGAAGVGITIAAGTSARFVASGLGNWETI